MKAQELVERGLLWVMMAVWHGGLWQGARVNSEGIQVWKRERRDEFVCAGLH